MDNPAHLTSLINDFAAKKNAGYKKYPAV